MKWLVRLLVHYIDKDGNGIDSPWVWCWWASDKRKLICDLPGVGA